MHSFPAYIEWDPELEVYVGVIPAVPGAYTQADTIDELVANLKEVLELCLESFEGNTDDLPKFVGVQQIEVGV
jgi:predicted RNase H-like HicB family nuclease